MELRKHGCHAIAFAIVSLASLDGGAHVSAQVVPEAPPPTEAAAVAATDAAPPQSAAQSEPDADSLLPPGEEERMADRPVGRVRYRPGRGLEIASEDREFSMTTRVRLQVLGEIENESGEPASLSVTERRARLSFQGNFFGADNVYKLELAVSPRDMGISDNITGAPTRTPLLDFYLEFRQLRDLTIRVGQYKVPGNRSRVISSGNLQMVDRSIVNNEFNLDRDVGLDLRSTNFLGLDHLRYYAGVYVGRGFGSVGADDFGLMYLGRVEVLPFGLFEDYDEVDFERTREPRLSIGAGYAYIDRARWNRGILGSQPADGGTTDMHVAFADALFMYGGFSASSELMLRNGHRNPGSAVDDMGVQVPVAAARDGYGFSLQAGYLIPRQPIEISARGAIVRGTGHGRPGDGNPAPALGDNNELGGGVSWYIAQHPVKLQFDYFRIGSDLRDGADRFRIQIQGSI